MSIRFAAAHRQDLVARVFAGAAPLRAANDNPGGFAQDVVLKAALRHFARHGLGAAEQARIAAEAAFFANDREGYRHWLAVCGALDRRMAAAISARSGKG
jgi:hypothetical protein